MDLYETKFILETSSISEVNEYLQKGWKLINVYTVSYHPENFPNHLTPYYILAATNNVDYSEELDKLTVTSKLVEDYSL